VLNLNLPSNRTLLTVAEVAEALGFSVPTIRRWIKLGKLAIVKVGRSTRVTRASVERLCVEVPGAQH